MNTTVDIINKKYGIVTLTEAINAWAEGHDINCYVETHGCTYSFLASEETLLESFYKVGLATDMITQGVWYIKR